MRVSRVFDPVGTPQKLVAVVLITCVAVVFYLPSLTGGLPIGDSYHFNVSWSLAFRDALDWANPYPRWLPSLWGGAGGADLTFYAPLPFYAVAAIEALCPPCGIEQSITISAILFRIIAGLGTMALARSLGAGRWAILAALFMVLSPYHVVDWFQRQAFGELAGAAFLPIFLWSLHRTLNGQGWRGLTLSVALICLSHLPSMMIAGVSGAVLAATIWRPANWRRFLAAAGAGTLGLGIAAIYWVPAVMLLKSASTHHLWDIGSAYIDFAFWHWDARLMMLWAPFLVLCLISVCAAWLVRDAADRRLSRSVMVLVGLSFVIVTPLIQPIWDNTPLNAIQFPWRFLMLADIGFALAACLIPMLLPAGDALRRGAGRILGMAGATTVALLLVVWFQAPSKQTRYPWALEIRIGALEWIGKASGGADVDFLEMGRDGPPPELVADGGPVRSDTPGARIQVTGQSPRTLGIQADCPADCTIIFHRTYWGPWTLTGPDGEEVPLSPSTGFPRLAATLPAGSGAYALDLPLTSAQRTGRWLSAISVLLFLGLIVRARLAAARKITIQSP